MQNARVRLAHAAVLAQLEKSHLTQTTVVAPLGYQFPARRARRIRPTR